MNISDSTFKILSVEMIESSSEINEWLSQFSKNNQPLAKTLLSRLVFVPRDVYSSWLRESLEQHLTDDLVALYSVRKLKKMRIFGILRVYL